MLDLFLTVLCLSGFVCASSRWLKINFSFAPFFSVSLIGILLFVFSVSNYLEPGTRYLIFAGFILAFLCGVDAWYNRETFQAYWPAQLYILFVSLIVVSYLVVLGMKFTVIDDYVYWGIIGKYLYMNHHLPDADSTIIARHLAYTPGTSLFHYFFYTLTGKYNPIISYFAQNILLISALFVVVKKEAQKRTLILLCLLVLLLTLFSGSVFTKLQVDYLLSVYFFSILWIYFKGRPTYLTLLTISLPACFLFLIKEIGLALCLLILIVIIFDLIFDKRLDWKTRFKFILFVVFTGSILFGLKSAWTDHCQVMGFLKFNSAVNMNSLLHSVHIFSDDTIRNGFYIIAKSVLIGPADRINFPYIFWYMVIVFLWIKIFVKAENKSKMRYARLLKILSVSFIIYLIMLYFQQIIIFNVGGSFDHTVGMTRYLNIFFAQVVFFTILVFTELYFFQRKISNKILSVFIVFTLLALGVSRVETSLRRDKHDITAEQIAKRIETIIDQGKHNSICIVPGNNDNLLGIKLLYHLLPTRVNYSRFPTGNKKIFFSNLFDYDYVLFNDPSDKVMEWINPFLDKSFKHQGFFVIRRDEKQKVGKESLLGLEKLF